MTNIDEAALNVEPIRRRYSFLNDAGERIEENLDDVMVFSATGELNEIASITGYLASDEAPPTEPGSAFNTYAPEQGAIHAPRHRPFKQRAFGGRPLYRHLSQSIAKVAARQSFVVTTGTGSGKSLCFFIPIIDAAIRARAAGEAPRTRAIVIYPMNALANSQLEELTKFVGQSGLPEKLRPTFERYTGQEEADERERIRELRPDILLTNFMMLELLMTRQNSLDQAVIGNAQDLDFIVLDELHTYRGRQGADVALLVRRLRDRLCRDRAPICIGTSATMVSDDASTDPAASVAVVASRLFGTQITSDGVIGESLERATDPKTNVKSAGDRLASAVTGEIPDLLSDAELRSHPLAVWIELEVGLEDGQRLTRRPPITLSAAAQKLAALTGCDVARCQSQIQSMLILMSKPASERGGNSDRAFLAFKLHQFFSGAGRLYSTLRVPGRRKVTLDGQLFDPDDEQARLYPTFFCRNCGQEHHPIVLTEQEGARKALPRPIDEPPLDDEDKSEQAGYLMPEPLNDEEFSFDGTPDQYPEDWIDPAGRVKSTFVRLRHNRSSSMRRGSLECAAAVLGFCPASSASAPPARTNHLDRRERSTSWLAYPRKAKPKQKNPKSRGFSANC